MQGYDDDSRGAPLGWLDFIAEAALYLSICLIIIGVCLPAIFKPGIIVGWGREVLSVADIFRGLWNNGDKTLGAIVFLFSVVFPTAKTLVAAIAFRAGNDVRGALTPMLQALGKWSMLDVFLVAITIVFIKSFASFSLEPRIGLYLFALGVVLNNLATMRLSFIR